MELSEREQRTLDMIERELTLEDPTLSARLGDLCQRGFRLSFPQRGHMLVVLIAVVIGALAMVALTAIATGMNANVG